jgi:hypothetical protein
MIKKMLQYRIAAADENIRPARFEGYSVFGREPGTDWNVNNHKGDELE